MVAVGYVLVVVRLVLGRLIWGNVLADLSFVLGGSFRVHQLKQIPSEGPPEHRELERIEILSNYRYFIWAHNQNMYSQLISPQHRQPKVNPGTNKSLQTSSLRQ